MKTIHFDEIESTNNFCKSYEIRENLIVTANRQTAGRGTKGRSFSSEKGGLYISTLKFDLPYQSNASFHIMINSCVAVCKTLQAFGISPVIRWANDVLVNGRKICGTLIENTLSGKIISRSVVGIGLNINNDLPQELKDIAISMKEVLGRELPVEQVRLCLIKELQKEFTVADYKSYIPWFESEITLNKNGVILKAIAKDVDEEGHLICMIDGKLQKISSAEVSLRL